VTWGRCGCGVDWAGFGFGFKPMSCIKRRLGLDPLCWMVACAGKKYIWAEKSRDGKFFGTREFLEILREQNIFGLRNHEMGSFSECGNFLKF
jgi:hypothetical protein